LQTDDGFAFTQLSPPALLGGRRRQPAGANGVDKNMETHMSKGQSLQEPYLNALRNLSALNNIMIKLVPCGASPDTESVRSPLSL
jgi:hypothetical protein